MARRAGINPKALDRIRSELSNPQEVPSPFSRAVEQSTRQQAPPTQQSHSQADEESDDGWSPWVPTPQSTRVARFRYNFPSMGLEVDWTNGKNNGFMYSGVPESTFRDFSSAPSKGKFVNEVLNTFI